MKIEIVRRLNDRDTLIVNELANQSTYKDKVKLVKAILEEVSKEFL